MSSQTDALAQGRSESLARRPAISNGFSTPARAGGAGRSEGRKMLTSAARIAIGRIKADPDQPRKTFGTEADERLAENMRIRGQLVPILVRWVSDADVYMVIDGGRRLDAAQRAGLTDLACVVEDEADPATILELQLITNALREDVAPAEQGRAYQRLIEAQGLTHRELADKLQISHATVTRAIGLLNLPVPIQEAVDSGRLAPSTALAIGKIEDADEQIAMTSQAIEGKMSRAQVESAVQKTSKPKTAGKGGPSKGKPKPIMSRVFKYEAGLKIIAERAKGIDPAALIAALERTVETIRDELAEAG